MNIWKKFFGTKNVRILSLDGGGIRGLIPVILMKRLEEILQERTGRKDAAIFEFFDFFAGTSTGAILTSMLLYPGKKNRPKYTVNDVLDVYTKRGNEVFDMKLNQMLLSVGGIADKRYHAKSFESVLYEFFGNVRVSQLLRPCLITAYDIERMQPIFFNQYRALRDSEYDFLVRDIVRSSTAAPTYFEPARINSSSGVQYTLIDGATFSNNPTQNAISEVMSTGDEKVGYGNLTVLSLGTGKMVKSYSYEDARGWGFLGWAMPILEIMMSGVSESVEHQITELFRAANRTDHYLRINPILDYTNPNPSLDNVSPAHIEKLQEIGHRTIAENERSLQNFADLLIMK